MYTAILVACLISAPHDCRSYELPLASWHPVMMWKEASEKAGTWLQGHPDMQKLSLKVVVGRGA
jgi:hypothetical protein